MFGERDGPGIDAVRGAPPAIFAIAVLNAAIGFCQQFKAEKPIAALNRMTAPHAKVRRDGQVISIPAAGVVVGDILALEAGDVVAADARLLATASLESIESALTGDAHFTQTDGAWKTGGDPPEGASLVAGARAGGDRQRIERELPEQHEHPFDADRKRSAIPLLVLQLEMVRQRWGQRRTESPAYATAT